MNAIGRILALDLGKKRIGLALSDELGFTAQGLETLERDLKLFVFGQDEAIQTLSSAIKLSRAGLGHPEKPVGSFLFAGPTGVGKTEMAKQLASALGIGDRPGLRELSRSLAKATLRTVARPIR